jgi:hypothetical protein
MKFIVISIIIVIGIVGVFAVSNYDHPSTLLDQYTTKIVFDKDVSVVNLVGLKFPGEIQHKITNVETTKFLTFGHSEHNGKILENGEWLVITMDIENIGKAKSYTFGSWYKVIDSKEREFQSVTSNGNLESKASYYNFELIPGIPQEGKIAIQIPEDKSQKYTLILEVGTEGYARYQINEIGNISFEN